MNGDSRNRVQGVQCLAAACAMVMLASCTARSPLVQPPALKHPDFPFPVVPRDLQRTLAVEHLDQGWRYLQNDDVSNAASEFRTALERTPEFVPAQAGQGYVALARREYARALAAFDVALRSRATYAPALIGRGQSLLALERDDEALRAFEDALVADPSLPDLRRHVEVLRFRRLQNTIDAASAAASAGRLDEARAAYARALEASPDSGFLHRDVGAVERTQGNAPAALEHFRRAVQLDPSDVVSLVALGELLEERRDFAGAESAYRRAAAIEPSAVTTTRIAAVADRAREASLPPEYDAILESGQITRGDLAALIGARLESVLRRAPAVQVVMTDTRGHWAMPWILAVASAGVLEPFENHTFQPGMPMQRVGLAAAARRLLALMAQARPALGVHLEARPAIADIGGDHLSYPAVAAAVASGVLPLVEADRFEPARPLSGREAVDAIDRLRALASDAS